VPPFYDSLLAKIIVHAPTRGAALSRARAALVNARIDGVATNLPMHRAILDDPAFVKGGVDTRFFDTFIMATA
jgi:acetyl-CoA carboxylase biotin carboxylase subunit